MTGLKLKNKEKILIQKLKMIDNWQNQSRKSQKHNIVIVQDILSVVIELKQKAQELQDIAKEIQKKMDIEQDMEMDSFDPIEVLLNASCVTKS